MFDLSHPVAIGMRTGFSGLFLIAVFMRFFLRACRRAKDRAVREQLSGPWGPMIAAMSWKWPHLYFMLFPAIVGLGLLIQRFWPLQVFPDQEGLSIYVFIGAIIVWLPLMFVCTYVFENFEESCRRELQDRTKPFATPPTTA